jgi:hypothetical protein
MLRTRLVLALAKGDGGWSPGQLPPSFPQGSFLFGLPNRLSLKLQRRFSQLLLLWLAAHVLLTVVEGLRNDLRQLPDQSTTSPGGFFLH